MKIHSTAIVEDGARISDAAEVGPYCILSAGAVIGERVRLLSHVVIAGNTEIGAGTIVHPHAVLGGDAQIRNGEAPEARLVIGGDNVIREGVTISTGSRKGIGITQIGDRGYFMAYSHIGHDCHIGNDVTLSNGVQIGGHVEIGDSVIMGGLAAAQQFSRIGSYAFVSGLSGVNSDIIPYGMALGMHAKLGGLNLVGLRRRGIPRPNIHALRAAFRAIFQETQGSIQERATAAANDWPDVPEVQAVTTFILADAKCQIASARVRGKPADDGA
jgi:UDP-N-acetylglucosamine acyltransferase